MRLVLAIAAALLLLASTSACTNSTSGSITPAPQSAEKHPQGWPPY